MAPPRRSLKISDEEAASRWSKVSQASERNPLPSRTPPERRTTEELSKRDSKQIEEDRKAALRDLYASGADVDQVWAAFPMTSDTLLLLLLLILYLPRPGA